MTVLQTEQTTQSRLVDIKELALPQIWEKKIQVIVEDNRMLYEPFLETADDFNQLRERLKGRGYSDIPLGATPLLDLKGYQKAPITDTSSCEVRRTMIRRKKDYGPPERS